MTEENMKGANMALIFALLMCVILSSASIHQLPVFSIFADQPEARAEGPETQIIRPACMEKCENKFRTFKAGAFHGALPGTVCALPIIGINALFERKGFKYIAINAGYWIASMALMGGMLCARVVIRIKKVLLILFLCCSGGAFAQGEIGLDVGQPINPSTGDINLGTDTGIVGATCTPWVRINFILGPWSSPNDQTLYSGRTWQQAYDEIIDAFVAKGIKVYGLIGAEAYTYPADTLEQYPGDSASAEAWIQGYVYNFVQIVDMFKDRVRVFESFNEPNNWTNSSTAIVHEAWFAKMLQEIYLNTKYYNNHNLDSLWQVTLVSGALFTFDLNTGGQYMEDTYWYGKNVWAWDWTHQNAGTYPLDGLGQHIYVEQASSNVATVTAAMNTNLNDFWNKAYTYEDDLNKQIWISEFGWESATYGESFQAQNLLTGFGVLQNDSRVRLSLWFTQMDFPGTSWGLYYMGSYAVSDRKLSFTEFQNLNNCSFTTGIAGSSAGATLACKDGIYELSVPRAARCRICDLTGKPLLAFTHAGGGERISIDLTDLPAGMYLLQVSSESGNQCFKLAR